MNYEGKNGGSADWAFKGTEAVTESNTATSAFAQTKPDASPCLRCVEATKPQRSTSSIQTMSVSPVEMQALEPIRMTLTATLSTGTQALEPEAKHAEKPRVSATLSSEAEEGNDLERKAVEDIEVKPQKRAKSQHDSPPWPRHLYMTCFRTTPIFKGETGTLHVDVQAGKVWFEGSTHYLNISKLTAKNDTTHLFSADCSAPGWRIWGSNMDTTPGPVHAIRTVRRGKPDSRTATTPPNVQTPSPQP